VKRGDRREGPIAGAARASSSRQSAKLNEGQKISYEVDSGRNGKGCAVALKTQ
jgi:hypothetical protein